MSSTEVNATPAASAAQPAPPPVDFTQEVRFGVVMYGGISLAVYINGVAQEMLRLVRATAPDRQDTGRAFRTNEQLSSTEKVYRRLGQILERGTVKVADPRSIPEDAPIRTRFLIDILSGSSAGGINAIFLAKALANDQQMDNLKNLWITEGDIGSLLNDPQSVMNVNLSLQKPPRSLLNSQRLYLKLLDALDGMEERDEAGASQPRHDPAADISPNVEELDLYITATDMEGQLIKLKLADKQVMERRHRSVFHFVYSELDPDPDAPGDAAPSAFRNDFRRGNNPFLAYAARCTSAHPAAFEPMSLATIDEVLRRHPAYREKHDYRSTRDNWQRFYEEYLRASYGGDEKKRKAAAQEFAARYFNDGGTLDNYPFSHTINALPFHQANLPVDRKMFYVEPKPKHTEGKPSRERAPDIFENAVLSLSKLPRYETIREDLQRVLERNRLLERVHRILKGSERDVRAGAGPMQRPLTSHEFGQKTIGEMIKDVGMGPGWGGYQRLRVAETTDDLALMLTRAAGFDEESDEFLTIRYNLVTEWRNDHYDSYGTLGRTTPAAEAADAPVVTIAEARPNRYSENLFLYRFDLKWRLRRINFVLNKLDEISLFDERADEVLLNAGEVLIVEGETTRASKLEKTAPALKNQLRKELAELKRGISAVQKELLRKRRELLARGQENLLRKRVDELGRDQLKMGLTELLNQLRQLTRETLADGSSSQPADRREVAARLKETLDVILNDLDSNVMRAVLDKASNDIKGAGKILDEKMLQSAEAGDPSASIRSALLHYYLNFNRYDLISYPILYSTNVGQETDLIEVFRISPEDATNADLTGADELGKPKLAGTKLASFGAFFKKAFRTNDILMGRLDGAERIITAVLPEPRHRAQREHLIREAQLIIISEEVGLEDTARLEELLKKLSASDGKLSSEQERKLLLLADELKDNRLKFALQAYLSSQDQFQHFKATYSVDRKFEPQDFVRTAARGTKVFGLMLEGYADAQRLDKKRLRWVTRLGQIFYGLVEVAVPDSIPHLIFRHWLKLLYFFELLMVVAGIALVNQPINQFGLLAFGVTVTVHAAVLVLGDLMRSRRVWLNVVLTVLVAAFVILAVVGVLTLFTLFGQGDRVWQFFEETRSQMKTGGAIWNVRTIGLVVVIALFFLASIRKDLHALYLNLKNRF